MGEPDRTTIQPALHSAAFNPILLIKHKTTVIRRVALDKFCVTLGRAPECDIVLDGSDGVSRTHAQILVLDGEVVIEDLNSRNGVIVNRRPVKRYTLRPGDRIAIGEYRLHVLYEQGDRLDRPEKERETIELLRLWKGAAITAWPDDCPLCHEVICLQPGPSAPAEQVVDEEGDGPADQDTAEQTPVAAAREAVTLGSGLRHKLRRRLIRRRGLTTR